MSTPLRGERVRARVPVVPGAPSAQSGVGWAAPHASGAVATLARQVGASCAPAGAASAGVGSLPCPEHVGGRCVRHPQQTWLRSFRGCLTGSR